jgi:hypothetical protein
VKPILSIYSIYDESKNLFVEKKIHLSCGVGKICIDANTAVSSARKLSFGPT